MRATTHNEFVSLKDWAAGKTLDVLVNLMDLPLFAESLAKSIQPGDWILFEGDLGAGKTSLVRQLVGHLGAQENATSPTFSILNSHTCAGAAAISKICHLDLYRLKNASELVHLGLELEMSSRSVALIEWAENVEPEGWARFFTITHCRRPCRIAVIQITVPERPETRHYSLSWRTFDQFISE